MNVGKIWKISDVGWLKGAMVRDDDIYIHDHDVTPYTYNFIWLNFLHIYLTRLYSLPTPVVVPPFHICTLLANNGTIAQYKTNDYMNNLEKGIFLIFKS